MNDRHLLMTSLIIVSLVGILGGMYLIGGGPAIDGESVVTPTPVEPPSDINQSQDDDPQAAEPAFAYSVDEVEACGQTCRDVSVTLYNEHDVPATEVTVHTWIYAGQNNTESDDLVWQASRDIGDIDAMGSYSTTERVELSYWDGLKIQQHDGWITIVTTVESAEMTDTIVSTEQVG